MTDRILDRVVVTELPDGVRYRLPGRPRGMVSHLGWWHLVCGSLAFVVGLFFLWILVQLPEALVMLLCILWWLGMAGWVICRGLTRIFGHSEIELRGGTLRGFECWGWLFSSWERSVASLRRFEVRDELPHERDGRVYEETHMATEYNVIVPIWYGAKREDDSLQLACGYPRDWLVPLAHDLARRCQSAGADAEARENRAAAPPITVREEPLPNQAGFVETGEPPEDTRIQVEQTPQQLKIIWPKHGVLMVCNERLTAEWTGWFGRVVKQQWTRRQLAMIRVARMIHNDERADTFQMLIEPYPGEGKRFRVWCVSDAEARWLATLLREALRMPDVEVRDTPAFLERGERPAGSQMVQEPLPEGLRLTIPAMGFGHRNVRYYMLVTLGFLAGTAFAGMLVYFVTQADQDALQILAGWIGRVFNGLLWCIPGLLGLQFVCAVEEVFKRAHRHAVITLVGDTLSLQQTNLYGTWRQEWNLSQITDVHVGCTLEGTIKDPATRRLAHDQQDPTWELHLHVDDGTLVRLFDGYDAAELQWLATVLRRAIGSQK
jgi:hypothetical protein